MNDLNRVWIKYASQVPGILDLRPDFRFDPRYYNTEASQIDTLSNPEHHYEFHGRANGYNPNLYTKIVSETPGIDEVLSNLIIDRDIKTAVEAGEIGALELAFELIHLGAPVDSAVSDFSGITYLQMHSDISRAGVDPLVHYLRHGFKEGRRILRDIRKGQYKGHQRYDPDLPTCLIAVHECTRTGAPIVGRDLAREAAKTHNVIVAALRDGPLLNDFREASCEVLISGAPFKDFKAFSGEILENIDFAILNSAVSWEFIPLLVAREIPFAGYIHEYSQYLHPAFHFNLFPMFADLLVFSSEHVRNSWGGRMTDVNFNILKDSTIIPQRPLYIGGVDSKCQASSRNRLSQLIGRNLDKSRVVCGAGQSQWRKGTDIFTMTAQICSSRDENTFFIWIGDGLVPDELGFGAYMAYHFDQIGMGKEDSNIAFIPAGPAYFDVLKASDMMFMSSRLDPLPNVVFDALEHGCTIVQFDGASGFSDEVYRSSEKFVTVEYCNAEAAATAILALPPKEASDVVSEKPEHFLFETIRARLESRLNTQQYFVRGASEIDVPIMYTSEPEFMEARIREREKMMRYGRRRVWRSLADVEREISKSDNWAQSRMRLKPYVAAKDEMLPPFALHIHAFYTDDLADDVKSFAIYRQASRIVVTTDTEEKADTVYGIMRDASFRPEIELVPNTGRDILPFMDLFRPSGISDRDELWCHLHQKKSVGSTGGGDMWRRFLMRVLLGDAENISNALATLADDRVGLVAAFDPHFVGWNESRRLLPKFAERLRRPMPQNPLLFPVGNMFWVRRQVVESMNALFGPSYPWPEEPIANDGSEYHLIERLWPAVATLLELDSVFIHKPNEQRV